MEGESAPVLRRSARLTRGDAMSDQPYKNKLKQSCGQGSTLSTSPQEPSTKRQKGAMSEVRRPEPALVPDVKGVIGAAQRSHISHWVTEDVWPEEFFEQNTMHSIVARKLSLPGLQRKRSEDSLNPSEISTAQRAAKSAAYRSNKVYNVLEANARFYISDAGLDISAESHDLCRELLKHQHSTPENTLFDDGMRVKKASDRMIENSEMKIIRSIANLLVPSAEGLAILGNDRFDVFAETTNEAWYNCIPIFNPRPQPDLAVGFARKAFTDEQVRKLQPALGDPDCVSFAMTTFFMFFPFLTCEVKCGNSSLDIADRQNAHSMCIAVTGLVELFKLAGKEKDLHNKLLTFSISHDHRSVRINGYYPILEDGKPLRIYRRDIFSFDFVTNQGQHRWTTYQFTVNVYEYGLKLLKRILEIIDGLPTNFKLDVSQETLNNASAQTAPPRELENAAGGLPEVQTTSIVAPPQPITPAPSKDNGKKKAKK